MIQRTIFVRTSLLLFFFISCLQLKSQSHLYSSVLCQKTIVAEDETAYNQHRAIEQYIDKKHIAFLNLENQIQYRLIFHNYSSISASSFESKLSSHVTNLKQAFAVDGLMFKRLTGKPLSDESNRYQLIDFVLGDKVDHKRTEWQSWRGQNHKHEKDAIHIYVYDDSPEEVGRGFAHFPWLNRDVNRAIILRKSNFDGRSNKFVDDHELTHLVGNYFGLYPLTGEYPCGDDYVLDTPIHNSAMVICTDLKITSTCDNQIMKLNNFMSHGINNCRDSFTLGQWRRMLHIFNFHSQSSIN